MPPTIAQDEPATTTLARVSWRILLGFGVVAIVWFVFAVSQRLLYPHELEWMEGALADHAARVADGLPLYCEPSPEHVPFLYAPMLFWLGALGIGLGIDGIVALRLVAVVFTVGSAMWIGHWVRRETGRVVPGLVAVGVFVAGYGWLAWWYDLARNDSLFVFWCLAASYQLRHGGRRGWLWAAAFATLALLAKQSAVMWLPAVGVGALCHDWRRAVRFGLATMAASAVAIAAMHLSSDGWSTFYLFEMPRSHGWVGDKKLGYWTQDLRPMYPLVVLALLGFAATVRSDARAALFLAAFGSGGLVCSWFSRMHVGGFDNVLMYGFAAACVLGGIAAGSRVAWLRSLAPALLLVQFGWLGLEAWQRGTKTLLPSTEHRQAHDELRAFVERQDGPVWIPGHGHVSYRAGKGAAAHGQAIFDLLQLLPPGPGGFDLTALHRTETLTDLSQRARDALDRFRDDCSRAILDRTYAAIVLDEPPKDAGTRAFEVLFAVPMMGADGKPSTGDEPYRRRPGHVVGNPAAINPLLGFVVSHPYALTRR